MKKSLILLIFKSLLLFPMEDPQIITQRMLCIRYLDVAKQCTDDEICSQIKSLQSGIYLEKSFEELKKTSEQLNEHARKGHFINGVHSEQYAVNYKQIIDYVNLVLPEESCYLVFRDVITSNRTTLYKAWNTKNPQDLRNIENIPFTWKQWITNSK